MNAALLLCHTRLNITKTAKRVLIYSHDSFGLGHIRRCRTIAHALAEAIPKLKVLIVSGSPIIASFDFKTRVDFVRVPSIIKLRSGDYVPLGSHSSVETTTNLRASLIRETALNFDPDLVIVDKEPWGLRGELQETLHKMKERGTTLVLGLRDVLDDPVALASEWQRKKSAEALSKIYNQIWIYGLREIYDPLQGLGLGPEVAAKTKYTGYLARSLPRTPPVSTVEDLASRVLVTAGGGGDGQTLIDWMISTYESGSPHLPPALIVTGPFMPAEAREAFQRRTEKLSRIKTITFEPRMEHLMAGCLGIVSMGGYNSFCEILSFDKRALLVPRRVPRCEQTIRAQAASGLGLAHWLPEPDGDVREAVPQMIDALASLPHQAQPSATSPKGLLDGLTNVVTYSRALLNDSR